MYFMVPWVLLGIMLALGLLVSVLYTSIQFYINGDTLNGSLWLVLGLISVGELLLRFILFLTVKYKSRLAAMYYSTIHLQGDAAQMITL